MKIFTYNQRILRLIIPLALSLLILVVVISGCSGSPQSSSPEPSVTPTPNKQTPSTAPQPAPAPKLSDPIKAEWIEPEINSDSVLIPVSVVEKKQNIHFKMLENGTTYNFMAYVFNGKIMVRANVCPPCLSIGFSLDNANLVCDRCATVFKADTGAGVKGACVNYPKAGVTYQTDDGNLVMRKADLIAAYQDTLKPG